MASVRAQLDELEKPNPRYMLELHTIRGMIQEADNMNKGLKTILVYGTQCPMMVPGGVLSAPQLPPRPHCVGMPPPLFAQPATVTPAMSQVDHEPTPSSGRAMSDWEDLFGEEVRIAMDKLRI
jgi:hypothetical protein